MITKIQSKTITRPTLNQTCSFGRYLGKWTSFLTIQFLLNNQSSTISLKQWCQHGNYFINFYRKGSAITKAFGEIRASLKAVISLQGGTSMFKSLSSLSSAGLEMLRPKSYYQHS